MKPLCFGSPERKLAQENDKIDYHQHPCQEENALADCLHEADKTGRAYSGTSEQYNSTYHERKQYGRDDGGSG